MRLTVIALSLGGALFGLLNPLFQKEFIEAVLGHSSQIWLQSPWSLDERRMFSLFAIVVVVILSQICMQAMTYVAAREGNLIQAQLADDVYLQTLRLRVETLRHRPMGEVVSLYATDIPGASVLVEQSLPTGASILFPFLLVPWALVAIYHVPIFATLIAVLVIFIINIVLSLRQARFFARFKELAAERTGLVNEWVQNVRALRILGWMEAFERRIFQKREDETVGRIQMVTNGQTMSAFAVSVTFIVNVITIASLVAVRGDHVQPGELVAIMWLVGVFMARSFRQMPWFLTFIMDGLTSVRRLENFLRIQNDEGSLRAGARKTSADGNPSQLQESFKSGTQGLRVQDLTLVIEGQPRLNHISFEIKAGEWIAIVGEVGSGKSLLLLSLLGETRATFAEFTIDGRSVVADSVAQLRTHFSFVPQEGFVMSASLRENVFFEYESDIGLDGHVEESLRLAQIDMNVERFVDGLATEIGERGVNLSGGQRQRVGLARAHFRQRPILLLDDCLSAVDVDTEQKLVASLLNGVWKNHTRLLVTHRLSILPQVDRIFFLENGALRDQGTWSELLERNTAFRAFVREQEAKPQPGEVFP